MRHATPDERIAALRTLRDENRGQATSPEIEQGNRTVGERTLNRIGVRLSRAFGGGSRPASGVPSSRPVSHVPATVAEAPATSSTGVPVSPVSPASNTAEAHTSSEIPASSTTEVPVPTLTGNPHAPQP